MVGVAHSVSAMPPNQTAGRAAHPNFVAAADRPVFRRELATREQAEEAEVTVERERQDTTAAIRRIAEQEEKQLLEAHGRRAVLLGAAIDHFNAEEYDQAESYARQVLAEQPDNYAAQDILTNSRRARHSWINERMLTDLKESYNRWQVHIEKTNVPWPPQEWWDRIGNVRKRAPDPDLTPELLILKTRLIDLAYDDARFPTVLHDLTVGSGFIFFVDGSARQELGSARISLQARGVTVHDALQLILLQASAEGTIVWELRGNAVAFVARN